MVRILRYIQNETSVYGLRREPMGSLQEWCGWHKWHSLRQLGAVWVKVKLIPLSGSSILSNSTNEAVTK